MGKGNYYEQPLKFVKQKYVGVALRNTTDFSSLKLVTPESEIFIKLTQAYCLLIRVNLIQWITLRVICDTKYKRLCTAKIQISFSGVTF